jgi:hypothetical protein
VDIIDATGLGSAFANTATVQATDGDPGPDGPSPAGYSGPSLQTALAPTRPATAPVKGKEGDYSIFYYSYPNTNVWPVPYWSQQGTKFRIHLEGSTTFNNNELDPIPGALNHGGHFAQTMHKLGWKIAYDRHDDDLHVSSLRKADLGINGGELATYATIGLFISHGTYGSDQDFAPGASGAKLTYWGSGNASDSSDPWLRMCQFGFGGNLKWMAILACNSLCDPNYGTMVLHGAIPLKETHLVCGTASIAAVGESIGSYWALNMIKKNQTVVEAWFNAGRSEYAGTTNLTDPVKLRVAGYPECLGDKVSANTPPSSPSPAPGNLDKRDSQVWP